MFYRWMAFMRVLSFLGKWWWVIGLVLATVIVFYVLYRIMTRILSSYMSYVLHLPPPSGSKDSPRRQVTSPDGKALAQVRGVRTQSLVLMVEREGKEEAYELPGNCVYESVKRVFWYPSGDKVGVAFGASERIVIDIDSKANPDLGFRRPDKDEMEAFENLE